MENCRLEKASNPQESPIKSSHPQILKFSKPLSTQSATQRARATSSATRWNTTRTGMPIFLHFTHICPVVKRIWTPSWTLFSGGACFLLLAAFSWLIDVRGRKKWAFPLVVIGMNSIVAYVLQSKSPGLSNAPASLQRL